MNFLNRFFRPLLNQLGQTPGTASSTSAPSPGILDLLLGVRKPSVGLLGEGAFSALGADPNQFATMAGLPAMTGARDLFRVDPAAAEELSIGEQKARENILNNTPMRGGELNQGLAQNIMHYGGLRQKLIENRRNEALNALQGMSGYQIPALETGAAASRGGTAASPLMQGMGSFLGNLGTGVGLLGTKSLLDWWNKNSAETGLAGLGSQPMPTGLTDTLNAMDAFGTGTGTIDPFSAFQMNSLFPDMSAAVNWF